MIFQSTTAESIGHPGNTDPKPWVGKNSGERYGAVHPGGVRWEPRPEFDRPPVNPILAEVRAESVAMGFTRPNDWLRICKRYFWTGQVSAEMVAHAHRVLSRLAALKEEK